MFRKKIFKDQHWSLAGLSILMDLLLLCFMVVILSGLYRLLSHSFSDYSLRQHRVMAGAFNSRVLSRLDQIAYSLKSYSVKTGHERLHAYQLEKYNDYVTFAVSISNNNVSTLFLAKNEVFHKNEISSITKNFSYEFIKTLNSRDYILIPPYERKGSLKFALVLASGNKIYLAEIALELLSDMLNQMYNNQDIDSSMIWIVNPFSGRIILSKGGKQDKQVLDYFWDYPVYKRAAGRYDVIQISLPFSGIQSFALLNQGPAREQLREVFFFFFLIIVSGVMVYVVRRIWEAYFFYAPLNRFISALSQKKDTVNDSRGVLNEWKQLFNTYTEVMGKIHQYEDDLSISEERRRLAIEASNDGIWDYNPGTGEVYFSPKWFSMLGYAPDELPHDFETWLSLVHDDDRALAEYMIQTNLTEGRNFSIEYRMKHKKRGWIWVYNRGKVVEWDRKDGRALRIVGTHADITDFKETIDALFASEERFRNLVEVMPDALVLVDGNQFILYANPAAVSLIGGSHTDELNGKNISYFVHAEDFPFVNERFKLFYSDHKNLSLTRVRLSRLDGRNIYAESIGARVKYDNDYAVMYVLRDISARIENEKKIQELTEDLERRVEARTIELKVANEYLQESFEQLQKTQDQLVESEKMAALGGLVAGVAHEINTPLGISVTASSFLREKAEHIFHMHNDNNMKRSDLDKFVNITNDATGVILSNLKRASELVKSFKQVAVDQSTEGKRVFNLRQYIDEIFLSLGPKLKRTSHRVVINCSSDLNINSYPGVYSQILTNLVMNSLIHGFRSEKKGTISIEIVKGDDMLNIAYQDNGQGMSLEEITHVFEPFFTTRRDVGGSGLGMYVVYNLVTRKLQGSISCQSPRHKGVIIKIRVPIDLKESENDT